MVTNKADLSKFDKVILFLEEKLFLKYKIKIIMAKLNYNEIRHTSSISPLQRKIHDIVFEADTFWGKVFDITLLILIFLSVTVTALDSVESINAEYGSFFKTDRKLHDIHSAIGTRT